MPSKRKYIENRLEQSEQENQQNGNDIARQRGSGNWRPRIILELLAFGAAHREKFKKLKRMYFEITKLKCMYFEILK